MKVLEGESAMPRALKDPAVDEILTLRQSPAPPFPSPADWRDHWIYFLLVDRFNNPAAPPRCSDPCNHYQGGNFAGIRERLPYLKDLGAGAVWLSPVLINPAWFTDYWGGYGISDFLRIEPRFCSNPALAAADPAVADREFRDLVDRAHLHGIYVILDIVLNHTGDLFAYEGIGAAAPWNPEGEYAVRWRDAQGAARMDWGDIAGVGVPRDAGIWPEEFQRNDYFRRRGIYEGSGDATIGDFDCLKELVTEYRIHGTNLFPVRSHLIRAYQYLIAKFDIDGFRIDTLQYVEPDFARVFGNAMREFALAIGKKNFFTFGEVWQDDDEDKIAEFIGRNTLKAQEFIGVDAAIDFPMRRRLVEVCKGFVPPANLAGHFDHRRQVLRKIVSSHGDAGRYYVTFLDNHDLNERFHNVRYPEQTQLALTCLMTLQGIPCIYYGTEQGLDGRGDRREYVREALWGRASAFANDHAIYRHIRNLTRLRAENPALRFGRQYFRECSGNGVDFGYSPYPGGVLAFSRILNDRELLVAANTSAMQPAQLQVVVDSNLHATGTAWRVLFSTHPQPQAPMPTAAHGALRTLALKLAPMEAQILG
jgi:glycosidase